MSPPRSSSSLSTGYVVVGVFLLLATVGFVVFAPSTIGGILGSLSTSSAGAEASLSASGTPYLLINILGVTILGLGLAYGSYRYHTRDRRLDPVSEAATKAQYDEAGRSVSQPAVRPLPIMPAVLVDEADFGAAREGMRDAGGGLVGARSPDALQPSAPQVGGVP